MIGNSNIVKYAMQLADDAVDLSGQIAGVNGHGELPRQLLEASIRSVQNFATRASAAMAACCQVEAQNERVRR
jgi:hypothetical protein